MPITENVNGVLHIHSAEPENVGGVIREKDFVHANDGGVLREIFSSSVDSATVEGITPLVVADDHLVIVNSGSFTLSAPKGARIIVGGAAQGIIGGKVAVYTLESAIRNAQCTLQCGAVGSGNATTLTVGGTTYDSGSVKQVIQSKWGPIGGEGGSGASGGNGGTATITLEKAYNGQIVASTSITQNGTSGGNSGGYGNFGGHGAFSAQNRSGVGNNGKSGMAGSSFDQDKIWSSEGSYTSHGGGGGGGYSAGGGKNDGHMYSSAGQGGAGIIVIEWDN